MFNNFASSVGSKGSSKRAEWSLGEVLLGMSLLEEGRDLKDVATILDRPISGARTKLQEGKVTIKGKTSCRGVRKYFFEDSTSLTNNNLVPAEEAITKLLRAHGVTYSGPEQVVALIEAAKVEFGLSNPSSAAV